MRRNPSWLNKIITQQLIEWGSSGRVDVYNSVFWAQFMLATPLLCHLEICVSCEDSPKSTDKDLRSIWLFKRRIGVFFGFVFLSASSWLHDQAPAFPLKSISLRSDCSLLMLLSWFDLFQAFLILFRVARDFWSPTNTWPALSRNGGVSSSVYVDLRVGCSAYSVACCDSS